MSLADADPHIAASNGNAGLSAAMLPAQFPPFLLPCLISLASSSSSLASPSHPPPLIRFLLPSSLGPYKLDLGNVLYAPCCWRDPQVTEALGTGGRGRAQEGAVPVPLKHSSFHPRCHSSTFLPPCPLPQFLSPISPVPSGTAHPLGLDEGAASRAASCRAVRQVLLLRLRQPSPRAVPQEWPAVPGMKGGVGWVGA